MATPNANGIFASFIWDTDYNGVVVPAQMGIGRQDQLQGSMREVVSELAGRVCYDSLGNGRSSADFHKHIQEVKHLSVYEHVPVTIALDIPEDEMLFCMASLMNRSGVYTQMSDTKDSIVVTLNLRAILEWDQVSEEEMLFSYAASKLGASIKAASQNEFPNILFSFDPDLNVFNATPLHPRFPQEKWIVLYLQGSRGMSHEQVRHGDHTSISQRSTRYVDESESEYVVHPLIEQFFADSPMHPRSPQIQSLHGQMAYSEKQDKETYIDTVKLLQEYLIKKGIDKTTARKQARGAARNYLGNGLQTAMLFGASVAQWKRMLRQRGSVFADAEIRQLYVGKENSILASLKSLGNYSSYFEKMISVPSPDGIGYVLRELT